MRILVIGGTRFIGRAAVAELANEHEVTVFHRGQTPADLPQGVSELLGKREELEKHRAVLLAFRPDVVLDMIAFTEADATRLLDVLRGEVPRIVVASSCDVYRAYGVLIGKEGDYVQPVPLTEDAELRPQLYPYRGEQPRPADDPRRWLDDYDKILVERVVLSASEVQTAVLRLPMVYGPRDGQHRLFPYLKRMQDGRPAIILSEQDARRRFSRGYVDNVGQAIALAVTSADTQGVYNVADEPAVAEQEWVSEIAKHIGWPGNVVTSSADELPESLRGEVQTEQELMVSAQRIRAELGYREQVALDEALASTIEWESENPPAAFDPAQFDYAAEDQFLASKRGA